MTKTIVKTIKYKITGALDASENKNAFKTLRELSYQAKRVANRAVTLLYDYDNFSRTYRTRFGKAFDIKEATGVALRTDFNRQLTEEFTTLPTNSVGCIFAEAKTMYGNVKKEIFNGDASLPNFRKSYPIPVRKQMYKLMIIDGVPAIDVQILAQSHAKGIGVPTRTTFKLEYGGLSREIFEGVLDGSIEICDSHLLQKTRRGKTDWYFSMAYKVPVEQMDDVTQDNVMGVDLGVIKAAYMAFNNSDKYEVIDGGEIMNFRNKIEARRRSMLRQAKVSNRGGRGRKKLLKPLEQLQGKYDNYRDTANHRYSKYIVDQAVKHGCGVIQMEKLEGINARSAFLKQWTYFDLQTKVKYKAFQRGIEVRMIDPAYTSQRCSCCGHIDEANRKTQSEFQCVLCDFKANADYNAAKNIADPQIEEKIKAATKRKKVAV